jgi:hypothetical protein
MRRGLRALLGVATLFLFLLIWGVLNPHPEGDALLAAKDAVAHQLRDGRSAEFRALRVYKTAVGTYLVCGEVNGRNGFSAMAGFSRFIAPGGGIALIGSFGSDGFDDLWATWGCDGSKGDLVRAED